MNKLDVALNLIRLLNERKKIDSRLVANNLGVSLRTAQRYLLDLSSQPCVITDESTHTYYLNPDYPIKDALLKQTDMVPPAPEINKKTMTASGLNYTLCLTCCGLRSCLPEATLVLKGTGMTNDSRNAIQRLISIIRKRLREGKCSFP